MTYWISRFRRDPNGGFDITLPERGKPRYILAYFDASASHFSTDPKRAIKTRLACFAAGIALASLAGCSHAPLSAAHCGRHFTGGSGLFGLAGAMGAFDREAGPDCDPGVAGICYTTPLGYRPPGPVSIYAENQGVTFHARMW